MRLLRLPASLISGAMTLSLVGFTPYQGLGVALPRAQEVAQEAPVNVVFTVTNPNDQFVSGLGSEDFVVEEDGVPQAIRSFAAGNELPLTLALLMDTSSSVRPVVAPITRASGQFLQSVLGEQDRGLIASFNVEAMIVQEMTESPELLITALNRLEIGGATALFDVVQFVSRQRLNDQGGRKVILLVTDGDDTASIVGLNDAVEAAQRADTIVYSLATSRLALDQLSVDLETLSEETGGAVFELPQTGSAGIPNVFEAIASDLRNQYSLTFVSSNAAEDGEYREIRIRTRDPNLRVRARQGYYAMSNSDE